MDITNGDPILVNLTYNGVAGTLTETLTDETTLGVFSHSFTGANFQTLLNSSTGYVGFTGATGGAESTQTISNFTFGGGGNYGNNLNVTAPSVLERDVVGKLQQSRLGRARCTSVAAADSCFSTTGPP